MLCFVEKFPRSQQLAIPFEVPCGHLLFVVFNLPVFGLSVPNAPFFAVFLLLFDQSY